MNTHSPNDVPQEAGGGHLVAPENSTSHPIQPFAPPSPMWLDGTVENDGVNIGGLINSVRRQWLPGTLIGLVVATALAFVCWLMIPVKFEAVAMLQVHAKDVQILTNQYGSRGTVNQQEFESFKQTQAGLMLSPLVLNAAIRPPEISNLKFFEGEDRPIAYLEQTIQAGYPSPDSELMRVSLSSDDPDEAKKIVNAVVEAYMEEVAASDANDLSQRLRLLKNKFRENDRRAHDMREEIHSLEVEMGTATSEQARINLNIAQGRLRTLDSEMAGARRELAKLQGEAYVMQNVAQLSPYEPSALEIEDVMESDPSYFQMKQYVRELRRQMTAFGGGTKGASGAVMRMQQELASAQRDLDRLKRELLPRVKMRLQKVNGRDEMHERTMLVGLQSQIAVVQARLKALTEEYNDQVQSLQDLMGFSAELLSKQNSLDTLEASTHNIAKEIATLELELNKPPRVRLIQRAMIPEAGSWVSKITRTALVWMCVFGLTMVGISAWDYLSKRLNCSQDVEKTVGIPVIGTLPSLGGSLMGRASEQLICDSIDGIRTAIMFNGKSVSSVVVTSAVGNEGKSTVASQLAVSMARSGKRTLLLDGDLRSPQQHRVFGLAGERGLSEYLRGEATLEEIVQATPAENLWILPAGRCDSQSWQALSGPGIATAIERLTGQFDFVIVDSGPILTGPDPLIYGQYVDGAVISTRRDASRLTKIDAATRRLRSVGIKVIGAVVNGGSAEVRQNLAAIGK